VSARDALPPEDGSPERGPEQAAEPPLLSPHELWENPEWLGRDVRVGGRVLHGQRGWQLADAFATIDVELERGTPPPPLAALAVARGHWSGRELAAAQVLEQSASLAGQLPPEFERVFAGVGRRLQLRARVLAEIRRFFLERDFLEVDTPVRASECAIEPHIHSLRSASPRAGLPERYLITSPELYMKRLLVAGVPRLFQLVHCFRAEELGPLHAPEFLMLEWYRAFAGWQDVLRDTEQLIARVCQRVLGGSELHLPNGTRMDLCPPFARLSVREAFARFAGVSDAAELAERDEDAFFQLLVDRVEPALAGFPQPVFLVDYPSSQAALAQTSAQDPTVAERFELYVAGVELCNGFGELTDAAEQRRRAQLDRERCRALGRHVPELPEQFLTALAHGMPRAGGNALGVDRLVMLLAGESNIDAVRPFPSERA
jgi:lysyl-tRNA synthetase class 2